MARFGVSLCAPRESIRRIYVLYCYFLCWFAVSGAIIVGLSPPNSVIDLFMYAISAYVPRFILTVLSFVLLFGAMDIAEFIDKTSSGTTTSEAYTGAKQEFDVVMNSIGNISDKDNLNKIFCHLVPVKLELIDIDIEIKGGLWNF